MSQISRAGLLRRRHRGGGRGRAAPRRRVAGLRLFGRRFPTNTCPNWSSSPPARWRLRSPAEPRRVAFERPFLIGKFEVTFAQWDYCHRGRGLHPPPAGQGVGAWRPAGHRRELGRHRPVSRMAVGRHRRPLPPAERGRMGIRRARGRRRTGRTAAALHGPAAGLGFGLCARAAPDQARQSRSDPARATRSACSAPAAMCGSGPTPAGSGPTTRRGQPSSRKNCGVRILQGEHRSSMPTFVRDIGSGGCSVKPMPGNFGFRVVRES